MKPLYLTKASKVIVKKALENEFKKAKEQLSRLSVFSPEILFWQVIVTDIKGILKQLEEETKWEELEFTICLINRIEELEDVDAVVGDINMKRYQVAETLGLKLAFIVRYRHLDWDALVSVILSNRADKKAYVYALELARCNQDKIWVSYVKMYCKDTTVPKEWLRGLAPHQYMVSNTDLIY